MNGKWDEWAATRTRVSAGKPGISGGLVQTDSWLYDAYKTEVDEEDSEEDEEQEEDEE